MAREIHDTVIQGCTGLSAVLEAMAITSANGGDNHELLDYARGQTQATIHEARRAVWDMRHEREGRPWCCRGAGWVGDADDARASRDYGTGGGGCRGAATDLGAA